MAPLQALAPIWAAAGLPDATLEALSLTGTEPVLPSSFAVGTAAQVSFAAAALAAVELGHARNGLRQRVHVDMRHAALECTARFLIDGLAPEAWDKLAGLYACGPDGREGWVRIHTNFTHHRDGVLRLLGLPAGADTERDEIGRAHV